MIIGHTSQAAPKWPVTWRRSPGQTMPMGHTWLAQVCQAHLLSGNFELMLCECWMRERSLQESSIRGFPCAKLSPSHYGQSQWWSARLDIQPASCFSVLQEWLRWKGQQPQLWCQTLWLLTRRPEACVVSNHWTHQPSTFLKVVSLALCAPPSAPTRPTHHLAVAKSLNSFPIILSP